MIIADAVTWGTVRRQALTLLALAALALASPRPVQAELDYAPPGSMIGVGSTTLHMHCVGDGRPTVIVDTGLGESALEWLAVQNRVRHHARICLYDRAGYGWSDVGRLPRTSSRIVNELYGLLSRSGERGPFVLVGHSFGGMNAQLFARRYPYLVAGVVLVDSSNPEQIGRLTLPFLDSIGDINAQSMGGITSHQFMASPVVPADLDEDGPGMLALLMMSRPTAMRTVASEYKNFKLSAAQTIHSPGRFPNVPLVVLSRGQPVGENSDWAYRNEAVWQALQGDLVNLSPRSAHIVARSSGHSIHVQQPELVTDAITMVLDFARADAVVAGEAVKAAGASTVLRFDDAVWITDTLHTAGDICPFGCSDQIFDAEVARAGHLAGTRTPAWQRIRYKRDDGGVIATSTP
jgi:pimeloyl-ACP methyl ester carboxylesterase